MNFFLLPSEVLVRSTTVTHRASARSKVVLSENRRANTTSISVVSRNIYNQDWLSVPSFGVSIGMTASDQCTSMRIESSHSFSLVDASVNKY